MAAANPSNFFKQNLKTKEKKKQIRLDNFFTLFANKVQSILNASEKCLKQLMHDLDEVILSQKQIKNSAQLQQDSKKQIQHQQKRKIQQMQRIAQQIETAVQMEENIKKLKIGDLNKKKQSLMQQLRMVDKQLIQSKLISPKNIKNHNQQSSIQGTKSQMKNLKSPLQKQQKAMNQSRTLEIMQKFNKEKIRRHEQIIDRMKKRQQQQMRKIQQLQQRRIKIQLKKSRINNAGQNKENKQLNKQNSQTNKSSMFPSIKKSNNMQRNSVTTSKHTAKQINSNKQHVHEQFSGDKKNIEKPANSKIIQKPGKA